MKRLLKVLFIGVTKIIGSVFFDRRYFVGRWFGSNLTGWKWIWRSVLLQKILGFNRHIPFPVSHQSTILSAENLVFDIDDLNNFQTFGCYFQNAHATIEIGRGTYIAPNVGIITANHDFADLHSHSTGRSVRIGSNCWIGMNAVILPGVVLGDRTVVGAGAMVTKSFESGNAVVGGNPAKVIRRFEEDGSGENDHSR